MPQFYDAFISYGRADSKDFATKLYHHLQAQGYEVWFDQNDIPLGVDYQQEIDEGLERSHNFIFVMSPHSVNSEYCGLEVKRAVARNKRIIPLLHVDELKRETWQQRNPNGTDADWANYQAEKRHFGDVRNPRIHPVIGKLNWIYGREDQDDVEAAFQGLVSIIERHKDYVYQHTTLLMAALHWEAQQRRSQFLLVGKEREQAEAWLTQRFTDGQLPCTPTELHAEYITESIKNANNMMTQVFISYANEDIVTMEKIRRSLWLEGITVWTNTTDIQTGEAFKEAIDRGIEQADNVVYLLSPNSIRSTYCQYELDYAIALQKRVIPILVDPTPLESQPSNLREMQYIDLTNNEQDEDYQLDESQLLRILKTDENYYQTHKMLLSQAIKWDRQHRNPSILLRGYNLQQADTWLKTARKRSLHLPTDLQTEFIEESLRQPPADSLDVFVSYSRSDSDFARKLNDSLQIFGKLTWFDQESIATSSADFQQEINKGIEASDNFLFILSPDSVNSPYCAGEVEYAAQLNKRFVTLLHRPVNPAELHPELAKVQWLDFNQHQGDFGQNFNELMRVLETDRDHVRNHTKWSQRAIEWEEKDRSQDLLLRGSEFAIANNWLQEAHSEEKKPVPTQLQELFLKESQAAINAAIRKEERQKATLRSLLGVMTTVAIAAICASVWAVNSQRKAVQGEVKSLIALSEAQLAINREFESLLLGLKAAQLLEKNPSIPDQNSLRNHLTNALRQGLYNINEQNRLQHKGFVSEVTFSPDGKILATIDSEAIKLWQLDGTFLTQLAEETSSGDGMEILFSNDGQTLATTNGTTIKLWDYSGKQVGTIGKGKEFQRVSFSPDTQTHRTIITFDGTTTQLWEMDGTLISSFNTDEDGETFIFSQDGQTLASTDSITQNIKLWRRDGTLISEIEPEADFILQALSADGQMVITGGEKAIKLRKQDGTLIRTLELTKVPNAANYTFSNIFVNPKKQILAVSLNPRVSTDRSILQFWQTDGTLIKSAIAHSQGISTANFSADGEYFASTSNDKTIKLWDMMGKEILSGAGHSDWITDLKFSPDRQQLASVSYDGTLKLWQNNTLIRFIDANRSYFSGDKSAFVTVLEGGMVSKNFMQMEPISARMLMRKNEGYTGVEITEDGKTIVTTSNEKEFDYQGATWYGPVQIWQDNQPAAIALIERVNQPNSSVETTLSPDGQRILTTIQGEGFYGPVQLWDIDGKLIKTLSEKVEFEVDSGFNGSNAWVAGGQNIVTLRQDNNVDGPVQLWNNNGDLIATLIDPVAVSEQDIPLYLSVITNPNSQNIITALRNDNFEFQGPVKFWDLEGKLVNTVVTESELSATEIPPTLSIDVGKTGDFVLITTQQPNDLGMEASVQLLGADGSLIATLVDKQNVTGDIYTNLSKDGQMAIAALGDGSVQLWGKDGNLLKTIDAALEQSPAFLAISTDGEILAIALDSKTVELWQVKSAERLTRIDFAGDIADLEFSSDSKMLAIGSYDESLKIWNRDHNSVTVLNNHTSAVGNLNFNADNTILASQGQGRLILHQLEDLNNWENVIQKGCDWLSGYLRSSKKNEDNDAKNICKKYATNNLKTSQETQY